MADFCPMLLVACSYGGSCLVSRTLVVVDYISEMVTTAVVGLSHTHTVVSEVDIAVIA